MFKSILEKAIVGALTALILALAYWTWGQLQRAATSFGLPPGIIVMAMSECSALGSGWSKVPGADGRFPVVAGQGNDKNGGKVTFSIGELSGEYSVTLGIEHMPRHGHSIYTGSNFDVHDGLASDVTSKHGIDENFDNPDPAASHSNGMGVESNVLEKVGWGKAHPNIPPTFPVNLCILSQP